MVNMGRHHQPVALRDRRPRRPKSCALKMPAFSSLASLPSCLRDVHQAAQHHLPEEAGRSMNPPPGTQTASLRLHRKPFRSTSEPKAERNVHDRCHNRCRMARSRCRLMVDDRNCLRGLARFSDLYRRCSCSPRELGASRGSPAESCGVATGELAASPPPPRKPGAASSAPADLLLPW
jgi:hypothetical protein